MHGMVQGKRKAVQSSASMKQQAQESQGCGSEGEPLDAYRRAISKFKGQPRGSTVAGASSFSDLFQERP